MLSINMSALWGCETDKIVCCVNEATQHILHYKTMSHRPFKMWQSLCQDICEVCEFWTGSTYVGHQKESALKDAYQRFFTELMNMLLWMRNSSLQYESDTAKELLYQGAVYRYIGSKQPIHDIVEPIYDNIYVSWSKNQHNLYFTSKLYHPITWMACNIESPLYGIDLEAMGCSPNNEREVVFPTIEECITEIKYISEDDDDET